MKLHCFVCCCEEEIIASPSGPHVKASCSHCGAYIKFLNKKEMKRLEIEEDEKEEKQ